MKHSVGIKLKYVTSNSYDFKRLSIRHRHHHHHPCKIMIKHCDNNSHTQFLLQRIAKVWNGWQAAAIYFTNFVSFRTIVRIPFCVKYCDILGYNVFVQLI